MEQPWREETVYADAEDGVLLHGTFTVPAGQTAPTVVFVHGYMVSANLPFTTQIARAFTARGHAFLAANTRGHDLATWLFRRDGQAMIGGAWYERFDESPHDLGAWISFAHARRQGPLILIGHSFGAQKAVYYQASRADPRGRGSCGRIRDGAAVRPARSRAREARRHPCRGRQGTRAPSLD